MEIIFYVLPPEAPLTARATTVCRLAAKIVAQRRQAVIHCSQRSEAEQLDELLWTADPSSFIPHHLVGEGPMPPPPIRLSWGTPPADGRDILINLSDTIPESLGRYQRLIEVVAGTDEERAQARAHWKAYKAQGYKVQSHPLSA